MKNLFAVFGILILQTALSCVVSHADNSPPKPIFKLSTRITDPSKILWLSDSARTQLTDLLARKKSGTIAHFAFAAGPTSNAWGLSWAVKNTDFFSMDSSAQSSLEKCEFSRKGACVLISIDGFDVSEREGDFVLQPLFLKDQPIDYDPGRVPFVDAQHRAGNAVLGQYQTETKPRALIVSDGGYGAYSTGENVFEAVAAGVTACKASGSNTCILYAVNNKVVYDPERSTSPERAETAPILPVPVVSITATPTDPAKFSWVPDDGLKFLAAKIAEKKSGAVFAFVFAASPTGRKTWVSQQATKETDFTSIDDLARVSLEYCENAQGAPCSLLSINGFNTGSGRGLDVQPRLLARLPDYFNTARVPFLPISQNFAAYSKLKTPKAFAFAINGTWATALGSDSADAIAKAYDTCKKSSPQCMLYAVDDRIVWSPTGPR